MAHCEMEKEIPLKVLLGDSQTELLAINTVRCTGEPLANRRKRSGQACVVECKIRAAHSYRKLQHVDLLRIGYTTRTGYKAGNSTDGVPYI